MLDLKPVNVPEDYDPSQEDLPVVTPIDDVSAASDDSLENKIEEYHQKAPFLAEHANYQQDELRASEGRFLKVTESVVMIQTLLAIAESKAPDQELFVEQEIFNTNQTTDNVLAVSTIAGSGLSLAMSIWAVTRKIDKAEDVAKTAYFSKLRNFMKRPGIVKAGRVFGVIGAGVSIGAGIVAFVNMRENQIRRRAYLESLTNDYQTWFATTTTTHNAFKSASEELETEIAELQEELGYAAGPDGFDAMCNDFAGNIQQLGELIARRETLTRLLCQQVSVAEEHKLTDAEIAGIVNLVTKKSEDAETLVRNRRLQIQANPNICTMLDTAAA